MEFLIAALLTLIAAISISLLIKTFIGTGKKEEGELPPGPPAISVVGNAFWLRRSFHEVEQILRELRRRYGPVITLRIGSRPSVFVLDRRIAHELLVERGASFSGRLKPLPAASFLSANNHNVSGATYGPLWRLLRRNLTSEILHPARVKLYSPGREWVLSVLDADIRRRSSTGDAMLVVEIFQYAMFCLLALMCFGEKLDERAIRDIESAQRDLLLYASSKLNVLAILPPSLGNYVFRGRLKTLKAMHNRLKQLYEPLIAARREHKDKDRGTNTTRITSTSRYVYSYLDSLLDLELPEDEGGRKLTDEEMVVLCSEFLNAGTDTTSTALQWIMANLVKHPDVQTRLAEEIARETSSGGVMSFVKEEELQRMKYLKAVVMEGLRRHPPGHFVLPHTLSSSSSSSEEKEENGGEVVEVEGRRYVIPKGVSINFAVSEMNWDSGSWSEPMEFRPERFMEGGEGEGVDMTGSREVKMMTFGAGRRICPGISLAMLHLEYFVANLVGRFEWLPATETAEGVDLTEKVEFTVVMKNPLMARVVPRVR